MGSGTEQNMQKAAPPCTRMQRTHDVLHQKPARPLALLLLPLHGSAAMLGARHALLLAAMRTQHLVTTREDELKQMAAARRQGVEALESAAAEGAVSISDAAALQRILEAVQDLCYYEPEGAENLELVLTAMLDEVEAIPYEGFTAAHGVCFSITVHCQVGTRGLPVHGAQLTLQTESCGLNELTLAVPLLQQLPRSWRWASRPAARRSSSRSSPSSPTASAPCSQFAAIFACVYSFSGARLC